MPYRAAFLDIIPRREVPTASTIELPRLHDRHTHVSLYAALEGCPDISALSKEEALRALKALPGDRLTIALGWHSARVSFTSQELSSLPPVLIASLSLHGALLSASAKEWLRDSEPELVGRHKDREWCERNVAKLLSLYVRAAGFTAQKLDAFMRRLEMLGVGAAEDLLVAGEDALSLIQASPWSGRIRCWADPAVFEGFSPQAREQVAGLKIFTDGALAQRTAALDEPYPDGSRGLLLHADKDLAGLLAGLARLGKPAAIHAIGRRAVEQALTVIERLYEDGISFPAVRLEHVQFIEEPQARRAKALGAVLCMQPNFSADSRDYADRLSARLRAANNPFRMLIDRAGFCPGNDLIFGSDGMPHGARSALQWGLFPDHESQRLTLEELAAGYGMAEGVCRLRIDEGAGRVERLQP
ncbi:MAG: amidohydrolase family protein [Elusimicrobia bacterium]|nr:amidohydrolase family protein [Elusimicrobiota bacterium]